MTTLTRSVYALVGLTFACLAEAGTVPAAPEGGGPRNWAVTSTSGAVNLREQASTSAKVLEHYAPGTLLDNMGGCIQAQGRAWCDVQELGGGARGYVALDLLRPAISPDGTARTGEDDSALRAGEGKFDATGKVPCAQHAGQPMTQCDFGVARAGGGYATVVVTRHDGRVTVGTAVLLALGRRFAPRWPLALLAIVFVAILAGLFGSGHESGLPLVADRAAVPSGWPAGALPDLDPGLLQRLLVPASAIVLLGTLSWP